MAPSPALSAQSEDDFLGIPGKTSRGFEHETVETIPVQRISESPEQDTLASLPPLPQSQFAQSQRRYGYSGRQQVDSQYITQPTQIIQRSPDVGSATDLSSPASKPIVQVAASSPITAPKPRVNSQGGGILGQAVNKGTINIAPAGTQFAPQYRQPAASGPQHLSASQRASYYADYFPALDSDDSDRAEQEKYKLKPKFAPQRAQPAQPSFSSLVNEFSYQSDHVQGMKRSGDVMASSYGNVSKRPRQIAPSRAQPVQQDQYLLPVIHDINDIQDPNMRNKVRRILGICSNNSIAEAVAALNAKNGHFDDAVEYLTAQQNKKDVVRPQARNPIILPSSDDELLMTPARPPKGVAVGNQAPPQPSQPARKPVSKSIAQKYSATQHQPIAPAPPRVLNAFDTPPPQEPKKRSLIRGRKHRTPSPNSRAVNSSKVISLDDSGDDADSGIHSGHGDASFDNRVLAFLNSCSALELSDISGLPKEQAEHVISSRPFRKMEKVFEVQNPNNKNKSKKGSSSFGERTWDKVYEMMKSYEAVDSIVTQCQNKSKPLARSMSNWGVDVYGKGKDGGLDLVNLPTANSQDSTGKDSGLGTPISDDGTPNASAKKGFIPQPPLLADGVQMKDYQIVGLNWLYLLYRQGLSGILADDMGLGKTLQTIAFLVHLKSIGENGPHLIVVPSATLENWLKEFQRFAPCLNVRPYYGSMAEREQMRANYEDDRDSLNAIVTTYVIAKAKEDAPWLRRFGFTCAVFDEGHMLKNPTSEVATKLTRIRTDFRLLLTGTPLQNNLNELMGLLKFLQPDIFAEYEDDLQAIFKQSISVTTDSAADSRSMLLSKQRIDRARSMLVPFILRRKKWQVLKDLPKKTRHVEICDMSYEQVEIYNQQLAKAWDVRERKSRGERVPADESANILIRLRQAAIHPLLFRYFYSDKTLRRIAKTCPKIEQFRQSNPDFIMQELVAYADFETHDLCSKHTLLHQYLLPAENWECSGKVVKMLELLSKFKAEGHRTLIFSQFVMVLDILQIILNHREIAFLRLDGSTRVDERQDLIDLFNAEKSEYEVFMLSTKAGGAGINLTGASRVIVFDSGFNPQDDVQAENRCHRIGQTKDVEIYRLVSEGTVEEQIYEMGKVKLQLDKEVSGADGAEVAVDVPISGIATPAELDDEVSGAKKGRPKKDDAGLSKREQEGAAMIEDMLFKKLDEGATQEVKSEQKSPPKLKLKKPAIKKERSLKKEPDIASLDGSVDSPLSELSSLDSDDERLKRDDSEHIEIIEMEVAGRGRRKAAAKASENLKDPFGDEPSSQKSTRSTRGAKKEVKGEKKPAQTTISRSGRLIRGVKR